MSVSYSVRVAKRVLILGSEGMLGAAMAKTFKSESRFETIGTQRSNSKNPYFFQAGYSDLDDLFSEFHPDIVINCLGVVKQSSNQGDIDRMTFINGQFPVDLAKKTSKTDTKLFHISTDCVFSGSAGGYTENDIPDPIDSYGASKLQGEESARFGAMVLRTSIIGHERVGSSKGLLSWFLGFQDRDIPGFRNAYFSGLTTAALSEHILQLILGDEHVEGIWHLSGYRISKYELLQMLQASFRPDARIVPQELPVLDRSLNDDLFRSRFGLVKPNWTEMIIHLSKEEF
jgi:dTDP-4-dehydrorhamnose reductase